MAVEPTVTPTTVERPDETPVEPGGSPVLTDSALSRRGFLRVAGLTGVAGMAVTVAACQAAATPGWSFGPTATPGAASLPPASAAPSASAAPPASAGPSAAPSGSAAPSASASASPSASPTPSLPPGWSDHDLAAQEKVRRFVGKLAEPLGLGPFLNNILPPSEEDPEFLKVDHGNQKLEPTVVEADGTKVFDLTIDEIEWRIDALMPPVKALGYNKMWPGPEIRVIEGDKVRINFTNNLKETTGVHFHGIEFTDFKMDGVPFVTQLPFAPGETFSYEFTARPAGSHMYHSHHNATDQVGRGLLGAFIVEPRKDADRYAQKYGVTQEVVFIHNDALGGFTINGHGFPATVPILAKVGDKVLIRYMNEGTMMHPWHTHGFRMNVVARDGADLGRASFRCDTLGVNPGERWDAIVDCDRPGVWAFHCHILPHVEGLDGMFGMVTALVILPPDSA